MKLPILTYHDIQAVLPPSDPYNYAYITTPETFEENITTLLNNGYESISLMQLYKAVMFGETLPLHPFMLTFDDGFEGVYTMAYPIMKKLDVWGTSFVVTDWVGTTQNGSKYYGWREAQEMQDSGLVEICSHSKRHIDCTSMPTDDLKSDISTSFDVLESHLGKAPIKIFCYPYGLYNQSTISALEEIGVNMQATGLGVATLMNVNLSNLPRISVSGSMTGANILREIIIS